MPKPSQTESARAAAGMARLSLRVSADTVTKLDELRGDQTRSGYVTECILSLYASVAAGSNKALKPSKPPTV